MQRKHQVQEPQKVQSFGKSSGVIPKVSNLGIGIQAEALTWFPVDWLVSSILFLLSTKLVRIMR
jgi:hypothetical protein